MTAYTVLGRVASTSSGTVWKARDTALDRVVALKETADASAALAEATVLAALSGPHVVSVLGVVEDAGRTYLVEDWVDGATLAAVLRIAGRLEVPQALSIGRGMLLGLAEAHRAGLVHSDVSMNNVMLTSDGEAKVIDFGSAVRAGQPAGRSTAAFRAPEAAAGDPVTPAADVYAAAAVIAALLLGRPGPTPSTQGIPAPLRGVLDTALNDEAARRYPDAAAFLLALEDAARRDGAEWWSTAGLGALVTAGTAALITTALGGAPLAATAVAGTGAAGTAASAAASTGATAATSTGAALASVSTPAAGSGGAVQAVQSVQAVQAVSRRGLLVGGGVIAAAAVAVVVAVLASGGDDRPVPTADRSTITPVSTTALPPTAGPPTSSTAPTTSATTPAVPVSTELTHGTATVRWNVLKNDPQTPLVVSGSRTFAHIFGGDSVSTDGRVQVTVADNRQASGNSFQIGGVYPVGTYRYSKGKGGPAQSYGAISTRVPYQDASFNANSGGGEVPMGAFGDGAPGAETCTLTITKADAAGVSGTASCPRIVYGGGRFVFALDATFSFTP